MLTYLELISSSIHTQGPVFQVQVQKTSINKTNKNIFNHKLQKKDKYTMLTNVTEWQNILLMAKFFTLD